MCKWPDRRVLVFAALAIAVGGSAVAVAQSGAALAIAVGGSAVAVAQSGAARYGFGKAASATEIAAWDIDVRPDGQGLPPGRGTVRAGQAVYDAQCASCHGTFGESNDYMAIAGGMGTLGSDQPIRTTGSKLNHATTLWDYINRAMPFAAPKTLAPDEVYAVTAYVLHLNDLLPLDGALDRESIVKLKLPNRDGFTTDHGLMAQSGRPDTRNVACMRDCASDVRLASQMPEHARDAHGNLADQVRPLGSPGSKTKTSATRGAAPVVDTAATRAKAAGCTACHGLVQRVVGPSFREIGTRYAADRDAVERLAGQVRAGGAGRWGDIPMPPHPKLSERDAKAIVAWILAGAKD